MQLPGAAAYTAEEEARLREALEKKGEKYKPRTHHLEEDGSPKYINELINETSPYLLQHAHNPVAWRPWGDEAFELARKLQRPVLLSVGYSTCHWCHVMERESFEDEEIAAYINANYIAIKVDREERPDVDSVYMTAVNIYTGRGGWPMTVLLTGTSEPFFGGTYFPARDGDRGARMGFFTILKRMAQMYAEQGPKVASTAKQLSAAMQRAAQPQPPSGAPGPAAIVSAAKALHDRYDAEWGGFGRAPKFPRPPTYELLLRYWRRTRDPAALEMVTNSLDKMANGGIYDHIGGGFHRYATDQQWLVPHFEKMLYDNAQLIALYLEAFQATKAQRFADVARDILEYVAKEMVGPHGGFYSATDADSEGHEGTFFVWTPAQLDEILGAEQSKIAQAYWDVTGAGNFEGKNILFRPRPAAEVAKQLGLPQAELTSSIADIRKKIYDAREKREHPILDDKVITEWNAQMISAFARASWVLDEPRYLDIAIRAGEFVTTKLLVDGRLGRAFREGRARHNGVLEDYAFFICALLDLFETTWDGRWLETAIQLEKTIESYFHDEKDGAFFATPSDGEKLLIREKATYDGAQPSGNSVQLMNLLRLAELTGDMHYQGLAEQTLIALSSGLENGARSSPKLAQGLEFMVDKPKELIVVSPAGGDPSPLLDVLRQAYLPNRILVVTEEGAPLEKLQKLVPLLEGKKALKGKVTAYVCTARVCLRPASDPAELAKQVAQVEPLGVPTPPL